MNSMMSITIHSITLNTACNIKSYMYFKKKNFLCFTENTGNFPHCSHREDLDRKE